MRRNRKIHHEVAIRLTTAKGVVFAGIAHGMLLRTADGTIEVTAQGENYLSVLGTAHLTIRTSEGSRTFRLENASASIKPNRLSVLAETVCEFDPAR